MKANIKTIVILLIVLAVVITSVSILTTQLKDKEQFEYSDIVQMFEEDLVTSFKVDGKLKISIEALIPIRDANGMIVGYEKNENGELKTEPHSFALSYNFQLDHINELAERNFTNPNYKNLKSYNYEKAAETPWYQMYLPLLCS